MPRKRIHDRGLPKYWIWKHGAYYFKVPASKKQMFEKTWIRLGASLSEAHAAYARLIQAHEKRSIRTVGDLLDRYLVEVIPTKSWGSQRNNIGSERYLRKAFDDFPVANVKPKTIYEYFDIRSKSNGKTAARHDIQMLSHMYTKAVEWGVLDKHPFKGEVALPKGKSRSRYVSDSELADFVKNCATTKIAAYLGLKLLTGLAKQDLLLIELTDIEEDGLHAMRRKTGAKRKVYKWDDGGLLSDAIAAVRKAHVGHVGSRFLFHTRAGKPYYNADDEGHALGTPEGFNSMWQRCMAKWKEGGHESFTEHDIRAKAASDVEDLEHAQALMDHTTSDTTDRIYRRKARIVEINSGGTENSRQVGE